MRIYPYSEAWDMKLNKLLDEHDFTDFSYSSAKLGDHWIWCGNHPYASFTVEGEGPNFVPSRKTADRAFRKYKADYAKTL